MGSCFRVGRKFQGRKYFRRYSDWKERKREMKTVLARKEAQFYFEFVYTSALKNSREKGNIVKQGIGRKGNGSKSSKLS